MARKRQLDPDFFSDEELAECSPEARLFFAGTWCFAEDSGVFEVKLKTLKGQIFPHDDFSIKKLYDEIKNKKLYIEYVVDGKTCAFIKGFHKRQVIQYPSRSFLPLPPEPWLSAIPLKIRKLNQSNNSHPDIQEISKQEEENLKKLYTTPESLRRHLSSRDFDPTAIKEIVKRIFPNPL